MSMLSDLIFHVYDETRRLGKEIEDGERSPASIRNGLLHLMQHLEEAQQRADTL